MATLDFVLAAFLDPVQAAIVLVVLLVHRGALPILVAGVAAAVLSETVMALAADNYVWGELIGPRLVSSLLQASLLCWVVRLVRLALAGGGARGRAGRASGHAAAFGSVGGGGGPLSSASRAAPWQARAFIRRRITWLRFR
jgi:hypothetical protein